MQRWKKGLLLGIFSSMLWEQEAVEAAIQLKTPEWQEKVTGYEWQRHETKRYDSPALLATADPPVAVATATKVDPWQEAFRPERMDDGPPATRLELERLGIHEVRGISPAVVQKNTPPPVEEPRQAPVLASRSGGGGLKEHPTKTPAPSAAQPTVQETSRESAGNSLPTLMNGSGATGTKMANAVTVALRYQGSPYQFGGTTPSGFDCSGFTQYVMNQVGVVLPRTTYQQWAAGVQVAKSQLQPGDLVFFLGLGHSGIYIGNGQFIHADQTDGITVDNLNDGYWAGAYQGGVRIR